MIGVFLNGERIGSIMHFPKLTLPCWIAYANDVLKTRMTFKTRKEAAAWLVEQHKQRVPA